MSPPAETARRLFYVGLLALALAAVGVVLLAHSAAGSPLGGPNGPTTTDPTPPPATTSAPPPTSCGPVCGFGALAAVGGFLLLAVVSPLRRPWAAFLLMGGGLLALGSYMAPLL